MGRDKRIYRFVQDTRYGRIVSRNPTRSPPIVDAVTDYVARRLVEREHALVAHPPRAGRRREQAAPQPHFWTFAFGFIARRRRAVRLCFVRRAAQFLTAVT